MRMRDDVFFGERDRRRRKVMVIETGRSPGLHREERAYREQFQEFS